MILSFITKPNCIILAVTPANSDLANSDALKLAREVDQKGERTIGVLTKVDIMDKGTDCMDVLSGKVYPLKRGYIGVALRSQYDIDNGKKIGDSIKDEIKFFENHSVYGKISSKMGTAYLAKTMNQILLGHIRYCLPEIKNKIAALIQQAQKRLLTYGDSVENNMSEGATLLSLLNKYSSNYVDLIDGNAFNEDNSSNKNELFGGSRINHIFTQKYTPYLIKLDNCENLTEEDIKLAIRNSKGPKSSLFIPEAAFEMLVKSQVKLLLSPSIQCCDQVFEELITILDFAEKVKKILIQGFN
jgi:replication fork clamp-binding protein CrfC